MGPFPNIFMYKVVESAEENQNRIKGKVYVHEKFM
jgi:hypothetical protein